MDISASLPGLKYKPGMTTWTPCSKDLVGYERYEDVPAQWQTQVRPTMFPPSKDEASHYNLERCIRILPHMQNTGGFFVAALHKVKPLPSEAKPKEVDSAVEVQEGTEETPQESETQGAAKGPPKKKRRVQGYKEDPFVFFSEGEELWPILQENYDLKPELSCTSFLTRCAVGKKKNIYFTTTALRDLIINNEDRLKVCFQFDQPVVHLWFHFLCFLSIILRLSFLQFLIQIINTGVKAFARCDNKAMKCCFRLAQEVCSLYNFAGWFVMLAALKT